MAQVIFVFAHQDDEIAAASRIRFHIARGDAVTCVYLTDGASRVASNVRDAESRRVLSALGVTDVLFLGSEHGIADGKLPEHLDRALALLESVTPPSSAALLEVVTLAWEGGHQDHDAAHLVALVFAHRRGVPCRELPLYNGEGTRGPFFRVGHPIGDGWQTRRITQREKFANALLCRFYASQRMTWLGLMPFLFLLPARELIRDVSRSRATAPPHRGRLLYERRFRYPYARFASLAEPFLREWVRD